MGHSRHVRLLLAVGALLLGVSLVQCGGKSPTKPAASPYLAPTSPENVLANFATMFDSLDVAEADSIFADDFFFRFQLADILPGAPDSLPRAELLEALRHLFLPGKAGGPPSASRIRLTVTTGTVLDDNRAGHEGWKKYPVQTALSMNFEDGDSLAVISPATLYFWQPTAGSGTWKLAEWKDEVPTLAPLPIDRSPRDPLGSKRSSWGQIFKAYK